MFNKKIEIYNVFDWTPEKLLDEYYSMEMEAGEKLNYIVRIKKDRENLFITDKSLYFANTKEKYNVNQVENIKIGLGVNIAVLILSVLIIMSAFIYCQNNLYSLAAACREANAEYSQAQHEYEVNVEAEMRKHTGTLENAINWAHDNEEWIKPYSNARDNAEFYKSSSLAVYEEFKNKIPKIKSFALICGVILLCMSLRVKMIIQFDKDKKLAGLIRAKDLKVAQQLVKRLTKNED